MLNEHNNKKTINKNLELLTNLNDINILNLEYNYSIFYKTI